jgi:intracellular sulfur oxidation DsrE/DsrF family protein
MILIKRALSSLIILLTLSTLTIPAYAEDVHKLVIQISSDDIRAQKTALANIVNVQKHYGMDNIEIEVVAFGPGYRMLTQQSPFASRISSLTMQDITFTACMNTMLSVKEKTGFMPKLIEGVTTTQAGVPHIIELQEKGYSYIKY